MRAAATASEAPDPWWPLSRYMQQCEGFRDDVTVLNLSMMTYGWWKEKRRLYPDLGWPGTHYTKENTLAWQDGAFTIGEFFDANYHNRSNQRRRSRGPARVSPRVAPRTAVGRAFDSETSLVCLVLALISLRKAEEACLSLDVSLGRDRDARRRQAPASSWAAN